MKLKRDRNYQTEFGVRDFYRFYKMINPKEVTIEYSLFKKILEEYYKEAADSLYSNEILKLPYGFGNIRILKKKQRYKKKSGDVGLSIDWVNTKKLKKRVFLLNEHRDGFIYKFVWKRTKYYKGLTWYKYINTRHNKRKLAKILKENPAVDFNIAQR